MTSPNNTVISISGQSIVDTMGNTWTIANDQVAVNGIVDTTTADVIEMAYENGTVWQKNTDNLWWSKSSPVAAWDPPYGTPIDPIPNQVASANDSIVSVLSISPLGSLTDASGNSWSIAGGRVTLNGVADPTTASVIEIAYVNGAIWQENGSGLWWSKATPADPWGPGDGTSVSPVAHVARTWIGGTAAFATPGDWTPSGNPQAGDTAILKSGDVSVTPGFGNGVNFALQGGEMDFVLTGAFNTGTWSGSGTVLLGMPGQDVVVTSAGISMTGGQLTIRQFNTDQVALALHGNSSITGGAVLNTQLIGTGSLPRAPIENDGTMKVSGSTLAVGELTGHGVVRATNSSSVTVIGAGTGETVQLISAHLYIGGGPIQTSTAMQFLAPVTDFGASSEITLNNTQATSEVFAKSTPTAGELLLYNGSAKVADLHISGQSHIYASDMPPGTAPGSVLLTAYDTGHSIPVVTTQT
jgi:hypothetical protein